MFIYFIPGNNQYIPVSDTSIDFKPSPWPSSVSQSSSDCDTRSTPPLPKIGHTRRNMGGRKPAKNVDCSPEEEERRRIRRERNKAAAARCRKRRVDHTNALITVSHFQIYNYLDLDNLELEILDYSKKCLLMLIGFLFCRNCH